jgi:hypothetical protein
MTVARGDEKILNSKKGSGFGKFFRSAKEQIIGLFTGSTEEAKEAT